jgi:uncharacterized protein involved in cysteine biosynthesis
MRGARHFRRRLLILSVSTLGFFISSFSAVLASDFSGPVVSVLERHHRSPAHPLIIAKNSDGDIARVGVCHHDHDIKRQ